MGEETERTGLLPTTPPNGITKGVRRATSILAFAFFFGLIVVEFVFGLTAKPVPFFIYALLASLAVIAHDKFVDIIKLVKGEK